MLYSNSIATDILDIGSNDFLVGKNFWDVFTLTKTPGSTSPPSLEDFDESMYALQRFSFGAWCMTEDGRKSRFTFTANSGIASRLDDHMAEIQIPYDLESQDSAKRTLWFLSVTRDSSRLDPMSVSPTDLSTDLETELFGQDQPATIFVRQGAAKTSVAVLAEISPSPPGKLFTCVIKKYLYMKKVSKRILVKF